MRSNNCLSKISIDRDCYFLDFFWARPAPERLCEQSAAIPSIFRGCYWIIAAGPAYSFPIFLVAFAPQSHKKVFSSPVRKCSGSRLSI